MNQTLIIATHLMASIVLARPGGNRTTQAIDALAATAELLAEAKAAGIDITDYDAAIAAAAPQLPQPTGYTPPVAPADPKPLSFGAKRKS